MNTTANEFTRIKSSCQAALTALLLLMMWTVAANAQTFNSGSTGSDGSLNLVTPGTYDFDPDDIATFGRVLDPDRDNVYHFQAINIGAGVTLRLRGQKLSGPVYWLVQGSVTIAGTLNLDGEQGVSQTSGSGHFPAVPGPGGYGGGLSSGITGVATAGFGPGGGPVCVNNNSAGGSFTGNSLLVPLVGGSGGGGGGGGGGAGGGSILIASSASISVAGTVRAAGGHGTSGSGGGAGGAIRLAATSLTGAGTLTVAGGNGDLCGGGVGKNGGSGRIRLEAFQDTFTGPITTGVFTRSTPFSAFIPSAPPTVRVVSVAGIPVATAPSGTFAVPDVTLNTSAAVPFVIEAHNIPVGTVPKVYIFPETGTDQAVNATALAGTLQSSTATANIVLPVGFSRGQVRAAWTP